MYSSDGHVWIAAEVVEEASSSNHMQLATAAFQEGAAISASASSMQHAEWEALGPADFTTPPWLSDSALSLPSANTVDVDLDVYGSGVSCGKTCCLNAALVSPVLSRCCANQLLVGSSCLNTFTRLALFNNSYSPFCR